MSSSWSEDYQAARYLSGEILHYVVQQKEAERLPEQVRPQKRETTLRDILLVVYVLLLAWNFACAVWPEKAWFVSAGWLYKNAEPSDRALVAYRVGGIAMFVFVLIVGGLVILALSS